MMQEDIIKIVADQIKLDSSEVTLEFSLGEDDRVDSIDHVEIIMALEQKYGIAIEDSELSENPTVSELISLVQSKL